MSLPHFSSEANSFENYQLLMNFAKLDYNSIFFLSSKKWLGKLVCALFQNTVFFNFCQNDTN